MMIGSLLLAAFTLVGGNQKATVVVPENAELSTLLSVEEFTNYVAKITGVILEVKVKGEGEQRNGRNSSVNLNLQPQPSVFIGTLGAFPGEVPAAAKEYLAKAKQEEASWTGVVDGNLYIVGRREVAELYATYHFLESKLGVIWFKAPVPEDPGEYYPIVKIEPCRGGEGVEGQGLVVQDFQEGREPAFAIRRLDMSGAVWSSTPVGAACAVRNGFQTIGYSLRHLEKSKGKPGFENYYEFYASRQARATLEHGGGHGTFTEPIPKKMFKDHPEYFALVNGQRKDGWHYCLSNPDVQRLVADHIIACYRKFDGRGEYLFGQADENVGWCECAACRAMDDDGGKGKEVCGVNISTRFNKFVRIVSERVWKVFPDADLRNWAYTSYRRVPTGVAKEPRLKLQLCTHGRCYGHGFDDPECPRNTSLFRCLNGWRELIPQVYTYEYFTCTPPLYVCHEKMEEHDIKLYHRLGLIGWKNEAMFTGSNWAVKSDYENHPELGFQTNWQWIWMTGKLLWDPSLDGLKLIESAEEKYYGAAYPAMKKYHALRRKLWDASPVCMGYPTGDQRRPTLLDFPGAEEQFLGYLDEAERLVEDSVFKFRIAQDRKWLAEYWIKPHREHVKTSLKAMRVNRTKTPPVVDGQADDLCWFGSRYITDFRPAGGLKLGAVYDEEKMYVLAAVARDDLKIASLDLYLLPPADGAKPLRFSVRTKGRSSDVQPSTFNLQPSTLELAIPRASLPGFRKGTIWKAMAVVSLSDGSRVSIGGGKPEDLTTYVPMEIDTPYLSNGSFEDIDAKGNALGWSKLSGWPSTIVTNGASKVLRLINTPIFHALTSGEFCQAPYPRKMTVTYRAKGPGALKVTTIRYRDTPNPRTGGYKREELKRGLVAQVEVGPEEKFYTHEYVIGANEWISLLFYCEVKPIYLDDVSVDVVPMK